ncbi:17132_t:CDS:2, partial [Racocetra persica]
NYITHLKIDILAPSSSSITSYNNYLVYVLQHIQPLLNSTTIVAYGDWKFSSCSKGHVSGPIKVLYKELRRRLGEEFDL